MVPGSRSAGAVRTSRDHCLATGALPFALRHSAGRPPLDGPATSAPSRRGSVPRVLPTSSAPLSPVFGSPVHPCGRVVQPVRMSHLGLGASIVLRPRNEVKRFREIHYLYTENLFRTQLFPTRSPGNEQDRPQWTRRTRVEVGCCSQSPRVIGCRGEALNPPQRCPRGRGVRRRGHRPERSSRALRGSTDRRSACGRSGRVRARTFRAPNARDP